MRRTGTVGSSHPAAHGQSGPYEEASPSHLENGGVFERVERRHHHERDGTWRRGRNKTGKEAEKAAGVCVCVCVRLRWARGGQRQALRQHDTRRAHMRARAPFPSPLSFPPGTQEEPRDRTQEHSVAMYHGETRVVEVHQGHVCFASYESAGVSSSYGSW